MENKQTNDAPVIVIEQQNEKKRRGALVWILGLAFVAVLGVGGTFAYLTYSTNQASNRITTDPKITADVLEPAWTKALTDDDIKAPDGTVIPAAASNMMPGDVVAKDPFVTNTSESDVDEYVGIELAFEKYDSNTGDYIAMSAQEVADILSMYGLAQTADSSVTAGLGLGDGWIQITTGTTDDYGVSTAATVANAKNETPSVVVNKNGKMYFYNKYIISSLSKSGYTLTNDGDEITAVSTKADDGTGTAGYKSSNLFNYIRFVDSATQSQIDRLGAILSSADTTDAAGKTDTSKRSWRVNVKGAAIQVTYTTDATGAKTATAISKAEDFVTGQETDKDGNAITWYTLLTSAEHSADTNGSGVRSALKVPDNA